MHLVMIGGSDPGISAPLRAREIDPGADVSVVVADADPNFSICGIPTRRPPRVEGNKARVATLAYVADPP